MANAAQKPHFPSKPCPKCGEFIHTRSKSHPACGWTEAAAPDSKPEARHSPSRANGEKLSKMEAVRRVLKQHGKGTMPLEIQVYLLRDYQIKMATTVISTYKNTILNQRKKAGRPKVQKSWPSRAASVGSASDITMHDIELVKKLVNSMGAEKVKALAAVLGK
jgi:hypothetical protein